MSANIDPLEINKLVNRLKDAAAICFEEKDLQGTMEYLDKAISIDYYNHVLWYNKAQLYSHMDSLYQCLECLHKSLEILPTYQLAKEGIEIIEKKIAARLTHRVYQ